MFAAIEHATRLCPPLCYLTAAVRTGHADFYQQRFRIMALGETGAGLELAEPTFANDHILAAQLAFFPA